MNEQTQHPHQFLIDTVAYCGGVSRTAVEIVFDQLSRLGYSITKDVPTVEVRPVKSLPSVLEGDR